VLKRIIDILPLRNQCTEIVRTLVFITGSVFRHPASPINKIKSNINFHPHVKRIFIKITAGPFQRPFPYGL